MICVDTAANKASIVSRNSKSNFSVLAKEGFLMIRRLACFTLICMISFSFLLFGSVSTQTLSAISVDQPTNRYYGPMPGVVLVRISEIENQPHYFSMVDNTVKSQFGDNVLTTLKSYGLLQTRLVYKGRDYCTYALLFEQVGTESDIIYYLQSLPGVITAKRDYPIQFLVEPNDHYYQPDSVDYSHHYVADEMNTYVDPDNSWCNFLSVNSSGFR